MVVHVDLEVLLHVKILIVQLLGQPRTLQNYIQLHRLLNLRVIRIVHVHKTLKFVSSFRQDRVVPVPLADLFTLESVHRHQSQTQLVVTFASTFRKDIANLVINADYRTSPPQIHRTIEKERNE